MRICWFYNIKSELQVWGGNCLSHFMCLQILFFSLIWLLFASYYWALQAAASEVFIEFCVSYWAFGLIVSLQRLLLGLGTMGLALLFSESCPFVSICNSYRKQANFESVSILLSWPKRISPEGIIVIFFSFSIKLIKMNRDFGFYIRLIAYWPSCKHLTYIQCINRWTPIKLPIINVAAQKGKQDKKEWTRNRLFGEVADTSFVTKTLLNAIRLEALLIHLGTAYMSYTDSFLFPKLCYL